MGRQTEWQSEGIDIRSLRAYLAYMSQKEMAEEIGIGRTTLSGYERGVNRVPDDVVYDIIDVCLREAGAPIEPILFASQRVYNFYKECRKNPLFRNMNTKPKEKKPFEVKLGDGKMGIGAVTYDESDDVYVVFQPIKQREIGSIPKEEQPAFDQDKVELSIKITKPESAQQLIDVVTNARDELIRRETVNVDEVTDKALLALVRCSLQMDDKFGQDMIDQGWTIQGPDMCYSVVVNEFYDLFVKSLLDKNQDAVNHFLRKLKNEGVKIGYNPKK